MDENLQFAIQQSRKDLLSFCVFTDKFFEIEPHHELIADHLHKLIEWSIKNLIISMPPRSGKSRMMQEFISYLYGIEPNNDVLYTWHSLSLLEWFSRSIRNRINSDEYKTLFDSQIATDNAAVKSWKINKWWEFSIFGVGGGITGKGGNYMVIDDPYASRQDAESDTVRRTVSEWYWSTFLSRKQDDKSKQIVIMQRWREDDLVWEILERQPDKWTELKIPALTNGKSFWESRFSPQYFLEIQQENPVFFASQYQQDPVNEWGGDFQKDYFQYYRLDEAWVNVKQMEKYLFIDPAISQKQEADYTAIVVIGVNHRNQIYVLEYIQDRLLPDQIIQEVFRLSRKWNPRKVWVEVVQYQKMLALEIRKQMNIRNQFFHLEEVRPTGEKEARIRSILQPRYSNLSVFHTNTMWELEWELLKFPNWKNDDIIDALSGAVGLIMPNVDDDWQLMEMLYNLF